MPTNKIGYYINQNKIIQCMRGLIPFKVQNTNHQTKKRIKKLCPHGPCGLSDQSLPSICCRSRRKLATIGQDIPGPPKSIYPTSVPDCHRMTLHDWSKYRFD